MAFQAEQKIKSDILRGLSTEQLFQLLSDSDVNVLMKTLGLLRNLLSTRPVSRAVKVKQTFFWKLIKHADNTNQFLIFFVRQVIFLFNINVRYIAKTEAFGVIQISVTKHTNRYKKTFERILYIQWNLVFISKYRARQLRVMFDFIAFSFQQNYLPSSLSVKVVHKRVALLSQYVERYVILRKPVFLLSWHLKYFCSYPTI